MVATLSRDAATFFSEDQLPEELGWVHWLSPSHQRLFAGELYAALRNPQVTDQELANILDAWRATAELDHDREAYAKLESNLKRTTWASVDKWMSQKSDIE